MKLPVLIFCLAACTAQAQEFVDAGGRLSDDDFYRLVICAAPPGKGCQKRSVRWSPKDAQDLTVGMVFVDEAFPGRLRGMIEEGLDRAMAELNASGANLRIRRADPGEEPNIYVRLLDIPEGATIQGTGVPAIDGTTVAAASFMLSTDGGPMLTACHITSSNIEPNVPVAGEIISGMLEELTQCMGFHTDIGGAYYESRSIFSETSNSLVLLGKQDIMALRRLYP